jgi:hypothetical protein
MKLEEEISKERGEENKLLISFITYKGKYTNIQLSCCPHFLPGQLAKVQKYRGRNK